MHELSIAISMVDQIIRRYLRPTPPPRDGASASYPAANRKTSSALPSPAEASVPPPSTLASSRVSKPSTSSATSTISPPSPAAASSGRGWSATSSEPSSGLDALPAGTSPSPTSGPTPTISPRAAVSSAPTPGPSPPVGRATPSSSSSPASAGCCCCCSPSSSSGSASSASPKQARHLCTLGFSRRFSRASPACSSPKPSTKTSTTAWSAEKTTRSADSAESQISTMRKFATMPSCPPGSEPSSSRCRSGRMPRRNPGPACSGTRPPTIPTSSSPLGNPGSCSSSSISSPWFSPSRSRC